MKICTSLWQYENLYQFYISWNLSSRKTKNLNKNKCCWVEETIFRFSKLSEIASCKWPWLGYSSAPAKHKSYLKIGHFFLVEKVTRETRLIITNTVCSNIGPRLLYIWTQRTRQVPRELYRGTMRLQYFLQTLDLFINMLFCCVCFSLLVTVVTY